MSLSIKITNERIQKQPQFDVFELKVGFVNGYERSFFFETYKKEELLQCLSVVKLSEDLSSELEADSFIYYLETQFENANFRQNLYDLLHYLDFTFVLGYSVVYWNMWKTPYKVEVIENV